MTFKESPMKLVHKAVLMFQKKKVQLFSQDRQTLTEKGCNKIMYRIRFGQVHITQENLGKSSTVSLPIEHFHSLSQEIKKVRRKERKKKQKA